MRCSLAEKGKTMGRKKKEPDRLAQDVSAATAAGMSYGKWKAMQNNPVTIEKKIPEGWQICDYCGKPYKPKTKRPQRYCEAECQRKAQYERDRAKLNQYKKDWRTKQKEGCNDGQS